MLNSPLLVSDNFLNEAHYTFIDFSYSFSEVNTPKVLLLHSPASRSAQSVFCLSPRYLSSYPEFGAGFRTSSTHTHTRTHAHTPPERRENGRTT